MAQDELTDEEVANYEQNLADAAEKFKAGNYSGARANLETAYELFPNPRILFSIAGTFRRQDKQSEALAMYRKFLDECSSEVCRVENREPVELAESAVTELQAEIKAAEDEEVIPDQPDQRDQPPAPGRAWRWTGAAVIAVGVGALGFAGVDQLRASGLADDIDAELERNGNTWTPALAAKEQDGEDLSKRARILAIGGGLVTAAGVGILVYGLTRSPDGDELSVVPSAGPESFGFSLLGRF